MILASYEEDRVSGKRPCPSSSAASGSVRAAPAASCGGWRSPPNVGRVRVAGRSSGDKPELRRELRVELLFLDAFLFLEESSSFSAPPRGRVSHGFGACNHVSKRAAACSRTQDGVKRALYIQM